MATLSTEQVRHVAALARLELSPEEEQRYLHQLSLVLEAVEQLSSLDVSHVEPTSHASLGTMLLRDDVVSPSLPPELGLKNAPAHVGTSFAVPKIIE